MRLRNIPGAEEALVESPYVISEMKSMKGKWSEAFEKKQPIHIEIGMGKGQFLLALAKRNSHINYVGMERYSSVMLRVVQKLEQEGETLPNLKLVCMDAKELEEVFAPEEVEKIYLNFSDPWPKDRHRKRRLPSKEFLGRYDQILKKEGNLEFKTDNRLLFDFAVEEIAETKWEIEAISYDLHADSVLSKDNIMTEYEEKFSSKGNPIYKYIIKR